MRPGAEVVERVGGALAEAGMARLPARAFAALLVDEDGRMTAAELAACLGVSPASVSGAVRYLGQLSLLRRERERGSRRDVYVVDDDAWQAAMLHHDRVYGPIMAALAAGRDLLDEGAAGRRRLELALQFLVFLTGELDAITARWELRKKELGLS